MFYYYSACLHLGKTKENVRTVGVIYVLGFINTGYFTSDNVPDGIKNATHNTFRISSFFRKFENVLWVAFLIPAGTLLSLVNKT
jgi:hypothetical protein